MSLPDLLLDFIRYYLSRSIIIYVDGANAQLKIFHTCQTAVGEHA
jgi:hypothetical protein